LVLAAGYVVLLIDDFRYAEIVYDFAIEDVLRSQEGRIDSFIKEVSEYVDAYTKDWVIYIKQTGTGFFN